MSYHVLERVPSFPSTALIASITANKSEVKLAHLSITPCRVSDSWNVGKLQLGSASDIVKARPIFTSPTTKPCPRGPRRLHTSTGQSRTYSCPCHIPLQPPIPSPPLPPTHPIDTTSTLTNTAPIYHSHILLYTGKPDWNSKIDLEPHPYGPVVSVLRKALREKEAALLKASGQERKALLGLCSFDVAGESQLGRAVIFPAGELVPFALPREPISSDTRREAEFKESISYLAHRALSPAPEHTPTSESASTSACTSGPNPGISILLCSHNSRDARCGILGPYLKTRIEQILASQADLRDMYAVVASPHFSSISAAFTTTTTTTTTTAEPTSTTVQAKIPVSIGLVSHVGGHKWAGNMLVYFHGEAARGRVIRGAWFGRVDGENVEGILGQALNGDAEGLEESEFARRILYADAL